jgi:small subunit ribosomal protein S4e
MILRNRLKYALNGREVSTILVQRLVKIDGKIRTDPTYPVGFNDVVEILRTNEFFRLMIDPKGRYILHRITKNESGYKLCRVKKITIGSKGIPFVNTNDGRTIRYPDPNIKAKDTIVVTTTTNKITDFIKSETGNLSIVLRGLNAGRIGLIVQQETHLGSHTTVTLGDALGNNFSTRKKNNNWK